MKIVLGIDAGASTTKIVGFRENIKVGSIQVNAEDQLTSIYGAMSLMLLDMEGFIYHKRNYH